MLRSRCIRLACTLGMLLTLHGCASTPESTAPFRLEQRGSMVKFAIADPEGLRLGDFLKVGQQVTGRVFTYSRPDVAGAPAVRLAGPVEIERERFLGFMQATLRANGFSWELRRQGEHEVIRVGRLVAGKGAPTP